MKFDIFKRKNKKEVAENMATVDEKEIKKAREVAEEKGADSQTERDREDESVAAQERDSGTEDTQTAKDRIDESEGTEQAEEGHADAEEDKKAIQEMIAEALAPITQQLADLSVKIDARNRMPEAVSEGTDAKLRALESKFMN